MDEHDQTGRASAARPQGGGAGIGVDPGALAGPLDPSDPLAPLQATIERARRGDMLAFDGLVEHFQLLVYNIAYKYMGDHDLACECSQEALLAAWKHVAQFNGNAYQFRCWLIRIVRNTCLNQQRFAARQAKGMLRFREAEVQDRGPAGNLIRPLEQSLIDAELRLAIERAIAGLSQMHQAVVLLDEWGLSLAEMAEVLEVPVGTIKSRLHRAREHVRERLLASPALRELLVREGRFDQSIGQDEDAEDER